MSAYFLKHHRKFNLSKQLPNRDEVDWEVVVIDATEILVQRPKKQKKWYSGKKKRHTFKFQLSMHYTTGEILSVCGSCEINSYLDTDSCLTWTLWSTDKQTKVLFNLDSRSSRF